MPPSFALSLGLFGLSPRSQRVSATLFDTLLYLAQGSVGLATAYKFQRRWPTYHYRSRLLRPMRTRHVAAADRSPHHSARSGLRISHVVPLESAHLLLKRVSLFLSRAGPRCRLDWRCSLNRPYSLAPIPEFLSYIVGPARAIGHVILERITTCRMKSHQRLRRCRFTRPRQLLIQQRLME
jgi:hypothetical protein